MSNEDPARTARSGPGRVLVVDDEATNRELLAEILGLEGYVVETASDGFEALAKATLGVDAVLLDVMMPNIDGFEVLRQMRSRPFTADVPVLMVTAVRGTNERIRAAELGANDYITKPIDQLELRLRTRGLVNLKRSRDELRTANNDLEARVAEQTVQLRDALTAMASSRREAYEAHLDSIRRLAVAAEYKDAETSAHIYRMAHYSAAIGRLYGLQTAEVDTLHYASLMHDVGKIGVPDVILLKPGKLTAAERRIMEAHTTIGGHILSESRSELLRAGRAVALTHHERWDGSGYPSGLVGNGIPLFGRICAVADVYDALSTQRPYKRAFSREESVAILREGRGTHFDPQLLDLFLGNFEAIVDSNERTSYAFDPIRK